MTAPRPDEPTARGRSWVDVDLDAIAHNVDALRTVAEGAELCAVVKANGYGHGAFEVADTALRAGASWLAVAQVAEGVALREAGFGERILVLSEPAPHEFTVAATAALDVTVYSPAGVMAAGQASGEANGLTVHLKVDTGMHRVGAAPGQAVAVARQVQETGRLALASVWTHLACADDIAHPANKAQLTAYEQVLADLDAAGIEVPYRHAANSAGAIAHPTSRYDLIRCGLAMYGMDPSPATAELIDLRPALAWRTTVGLVKRLTAGSAVSYGHRRTVERDTTVATIPVGYADGLRRSWWRHGAVLIGGRRRPILGVVTMDQTVVDCGDDGVAPGDEVVVIGTQGDEEITADEMATALATINYEVTTCIGPRVERRHHRSGEAVS
ncbi:MAG: alanine racemase [Actinomycetota bacterium]